MESGREKKLLDPEVIMEGLGKSLFSNHIIFYEKIDSTNSHAKGLASKGAPEGTIVLTEEQTAGRGRMDRRWISPKYENLLVSILLRPSLPVDRVFILTMILAIAVIDAIKKKNNLSGMIKWPNDLYIGKKKVGGILSEFSVRDKGIEYVILGLGLNVNWKPGEQEGLLYPATSILAESGGPISRNELLCEILRQFEGYYREALSDRIEPLYRKWNKYSLVMGKKVDIESTGEIVHGTVLCIDRRGALIIKTSGGEEHKVLSGDVSLKF